MAIDVKLPRPVEGNELIRYIKNAARRLGWNVRDKDEYRDVYSPGSLKREREYTGTELTFKRRIIPLTVGYVFNLNRNHQHTSLYLFPGFKLATRGEVEKFIKSLYEEIV